MVLVIIFTNIVDFIYTKKTFLVPLLFEFRACSSRLFAGTLHFNTRTFRGFPIP